MSEPLSIEQVLADEVIALGGAAPGKAAAPGEVSSPGEKTAHPLAQPIG